MTRIVVAARSEIAVRAAARVASAARRRDGPVLVLASGKTMVPVYRELARLAAGARSSFHGARIFGLDELRVPPDDPRSFRTFMERHLFSKLTLAPGRVHFLRGDAPDPARECRRYERELSRFGPAELALLGIGANGHVGYLEPASSLPPRTSPVRLSTHSRRALAADGMRLVPKEALTMGIETILAALEILLVAVGGEKAKAIAGALAGPITPKSPASFLTVHPRLTVLLDRAAAARLG